MEFTYNKTIEINLRGNTKHFQSLRYFKTLLIFTCSPLIKITKKLNLELFNNVSYPEYLSYLCIDFD